MALVPEASKTEKDKASGGEEHRVQKNKATDGEVGIVKEDKNSSKDAGGLRHSQLLCGPVGERDHDGAKEGVKDTHESIANVWVFGARIEPERAVVSGQGSRQSDQHLAQRWVHIEIELSLDVV